MSDKINDYPGFFDISFDKYRTISHSPTLPDIEDLIDNNRFLFATNLQNTREIELREKEHLGQLTPEEQGELHGIRLFPSNFRGQELHKKEYLGQLTLEEQEELRMLHKDIRRREEEQSPIGNLPNGIIKYFISKLAPEEQSGAARLFRKFEEWHQNPKQARVEWLLGIYKKKGWITDEEFNEAQTLSVEETYKKILEVCIQNSNLRHPSEDVKKIILHLEDLPSDISLVDILRQHGIEGSNLKIRHLENGERLNQAIRSGNDRSAGSQTRRNYHGGRDGEELALIRAGAQDGQSTYVAPLPNHLGVSYLRMHKAILIYTGDALDYVGPVVPRANGFSVFHFTEEGIMRRSLLAVIECK